MATELTEFHWRVPAAGYRWMKGRSAPGEQRQPTRKFLIADVPTAELTHVSEYNPLREFNGLFQTFAQTEVSEAGVSTFANKYGCLGGAAGARIETTDGNKNLTYGEPLHNWAFEILTMRRMIALWELAIRRDRLGLSRFIQWKAEQGVLYESHPHLPPNAPASPPDRRITKVIAAQEIKPEIFSKFQSGDTLAPAWWYLQHMVNDKLDEHSVRARLLWDSRHTKLGLHMVPESLIGCLWLQFAKAIEGERKYRQCDRCRAWFEIGGSRAARSDKKFCSPSCKASAHRKKREEALQLSSRRVPAKEIARRLGIDPKTVNSWLMK
jgi:hypothetical protein